MQSSKLLVQEVSQGDDQDDDDDKMMGRKSWFGFGGGPRLSISAEDAKEQAARLTREADIHRLYEAGTQKEVLEQLYAPDEVLKCIQKIEEERNLLKLIEETQLAEEQKAKEYAASASHNSQGDNDGKPFSTTGINNNDNNHNNADEGGSSLSRLDDSEKEGHEQHIDAHDGGGGGADMHRKSGKFTLRFDSMGDGEDNVKTRVLETAPLDDSNMDQSNYKNMDVSLDDVNLLELDSFVVHDDDEGNRHDASEREAPSRGLMEHQESEEDLLKELLNTEGEDSSHFDSVTTEDNLFHGSEHQAEEHDSVNGKVGKGAVDNDGLVDVLVDAPVVTIDTSAVMHEQSEMTHLSLGSNNSDRGAHQRTFGNENENSSQHSSEAVEAAVELAFEAKEGAEPVQGINDDPRKGADDEQNGESDAADDSTQHTTDGPGQECFKDEDCAELAAEMNKNLSLQHTPATVDESENDRVEDEKPVTLTGISESEGPVIGDTAADESSESHFPAQPAPQSTAKQYHPTNALDESFEGEHLKVDNVGVEAADDVASQYDESGDQGAVDVGRVEPAMDTSAPVTIPPSDEEIDVVVEDIMDSDSVEQIVLDAEEDPMDDREHMEVTSVEDDEELSEQSQKQDEEMNYDNQAQLSQAMDEAEELEEIVMKEAKSDEAADGVVAIEQRVSAASSADDEVALSGSDDDDDDSQSSSSEESCSPPPPPPPLPTETDETVEEIIEEYVEEPAVHEQGFVEVVFDDESDVDEVEDEDEQDEVVEEDEHQEVVEDDEHEEVVEDDEHEEEVVSDDESSYADQVVESWREVIEEEPEDLEAAVSALIAVVYKDEDVDVERMLRRTRLPELYKYLKQQYWYKIHTNKEEAESAAVIVKKEKPSELVSVDEMLKGRLQGLIANVQDNSRRIDRSRRMEQNIKEQAGGDLDESTKEEQRMQSLIANVRMSSRSLMAGETRRGSDGTSMLAHGEDGEDEEEQDLLAPPAAHHVTIDYVRKINSTSSNHHVSKDYQKAVNNRVTAVPSTRQNEPTKSVAKKVDKNANDAPKFTVEAFKEQNEESVPPPLMPQPTTNTVEKSQQIMERVESFEEEVVEDDEFEEQNGGSEPSPLGPHEATKTDDNIQQIMERVESYEEEVVEDDESFEEQDDSDADQVKNEEDSVEQQVDEDGESVEEQVVEDEEEASVEEEVIADSDGSDLEEEIVNSDGSDLEEEIVEDNAEVEC